MQILRYGIHSEPILIYHHMVLGLAAIKNCPLLKEESYANKHTMTAEWFNSIIDWLCQHFPDEFRVVSFPFG